MESSPKRTTTRILLMLFAATEAFALPHPQISYTASTIGYSMGVTSGNMNGGNHLVVPHEFLSAAGSTGNYKAQDDVDLRGRASTDVEERGFGRNQPLCPHNKCAGFEKSDMDIRDKLSISTKPLSSSTLKY